MDNAKIPCMTMDTAELHFKQLDDARVCEDFLEKEMLDLDVHHLEVRVALFDKLAVLAAGSLAVGISFGNYIFNLPDHKGLWPFLSGNRYRFRLGS